MMHMQGGKMNQVCHCMACKIRLSNPLDRNWYESQKIAKERVVTPDNRDANVHQTFMFILKIVVARVLKAKMSKTSKSCKAIFGYIPSVDDCRMASSMTLSRIDSALNIASISPSMSKRQPATSVCTCTRIKRASQRSWIVSASMAQYYYSFHGWNI